MKLMEAAGVCREVCVANQGVTLLMSSNYQIHEISSGANIPFGRVKTLHKKKHSVVLSDELFLRHSRVSL
jgi:hypothetical protein